MCPLVGSHAPSCGRQLWGLPRRMDYLSPQGVLLPRVYSRAASPLLLELQGSAAWQATPSWALCQHACHQLLPWLRATFAMVPDAAWPGSDQWHWSTAPAIGPMGRLGRPSASNPGAVDRCVLSLCCSPCMCVCGILAHLAPVHRCTRCVRFVCAVGGCVPPPPPSLIVFCFFFALYLFCFVLLFCFVCFLKWKRGRWHTAGTERGNWCSGAVLLCSPVRLVVALSAATAQGCGSRTLMYMGLVSVGLVSCLFAFGAGRLGGCVGSWCGLWLLCPLGGLG